MEARLFTRPIQYDLSFSRHQIDKAQEDGERMLNTTHDHQQALGGPRRKVRCSDSHRDLARHTRVYGVCQQGRGRLSTKLVSMSKSVAGGGLPYYTPALNPKDVRILGRNDRVPFHASGPWQSRLSQHRRHASEAEIPIVLLCGRQPNLQGPTSFLFFLLARWPLHR